MAGTASRDTSGSVAPDKNVSLRQLAAFFLHLGTIAFGGPAGHIALMEDEVVRRHRWLTREEFLDLLAASNLIPGPSSSELAIHIGYLLGGFPGLVISGVCFILPASCMVGGLAWAYLRFGKLQAAAGILLGVKPVVIAVVIQALWAMGRTAIKSKLLGSMFLVALVLCFLSLPPLAVLLIVGAASAAFEQVVRARNGEHVFLLAPVARWDMRPAGKAVAGAAVTGAAAVSVPFSLASLFFVFLKIGAVVFGSGYVLLAFLRSDLVVHRGWLTDSQLVDAIAIGQVTPGPVFTTATFVGYLLGGVRGALVATIGIFLPAFLLVAASGPLIPHIRKSALAGSFLDGAVVASLALMAEVTWQLGRASIVDMPTAAIALVSVVTLMRWRLNSAWLMLAGALVGLLLHHMR